MFFIKIWFEVFYQNFTCISLGEADFMIMHDSFFFFHILVFPSKYDFKTSKNPPGAISYITLFPGNR